MVPARRNLAVVQIRGFAAKIGLDLCRKGRIGSVARAGYPGVDYSGLASQNAGLGVVGAPMRALPKPRSP